VTEHEQWLRVVERTAEAEGVALVSLKDPGSVSVAL
jgi:hypothetical protein